MNGHFNYSLNHILRKPIYHLPNKLTWFQARSADIRGIQERLHSLHICSNTSQPSVHQCIVSGIGGVGKSATTLEYAHEHKGQYDMIWWIQSENYKSMSNDFLDLGEQLGIINKREEAERQAVLKVRNWLEESGRLAIPVSSAACQDVKPQSDPRWLLVFDNVKVAADLSVFLPQAMPRAISLCRAVIVTSRSPSFQLPGSSTGILISPMTPNEGRALLQSMLVLDCRSTPDQWEALSAVSEVCGGLPLILRSTYTFVMAHNLSWSEFLDGFNELNPCWLEDRNNSLYSQRDQIMSFLDGLLADIPPETLDLVYAMSFYQESSIPCCFVSSLISNSRTNEPRGSGYAPRVPFQS